MNELRVMISGTWVTCDLYKLNLTNLIFTNRTSGMIVRTDQSALTPEEGCSQSALWSQERSAVTCCRGRNQTDFIWEVILLFSRFNETFLDFYVDQTFWISVFYCCSLSSLFMFQSSGFDFMSSVVRLTRDERKLWLAEKSNHKFFFSLFIIIWFCVFFSNSPTDCWEM